MVLLLLLLHLLPMAMIIAPVVRGEARDGIEAVAAAADGDVARLPSLSSRWHAVHGNKCNAMRCDAMQ